MNHCIPRAFTAAAGALAVFVLAACSSPGSSPLTSCSELPDFDTACSEKGYQYEPDWKEAQARLPPVPADEDLARIDSPQVGNAYDVFIDCKSVSRGRDGVMRYTVVVRSRSGARNVFHEGLRCLTDEVRTYAFATRGNTFQRSSRATWRRLADVGPRAYQDYLANVIMCDADGYAWDADKVLHALAGQYTAGGVRIEANCTDQDHCGNYNRND